MVLATLTIVQIILVQRGIIFHKREEYYVKNRIKDMNDLYDNIIRDAGKTLDIIAKRAISISTSNVIGDGVALTNADEVIEELMMNGTFNGTEEEMMENSTIPDWSGNMEDIGDLKGYYLSIDFRDLEVKAYDSFNLLVESDLTINITDKNNVASIVRNYTASQVVSVSGFEDALYPLNTNGMITRKIDESPYEGNFTQLLDSGSGDNDWVRGITFKGDSSSAVSYPNKSSRALVMNDPTQVDSWILNEYLGVASELEPENTTNVPYVYGINLTVVPNNTYVLVDGDNGKVWFIENFVDHVVEGYYYSSSEGPSFLDRLEGKLGIQSKYSSQTTNEIGLESFVNKTNFIAHQLSVDTGKTNIDYLYFSNTTQPGEEVKGVDSYFRIDDNHTSTYAVEEIIVE